MKIIAFVLVILLSFPAVVLAEDCDVDCLLLLIEEEADRILSFREDQERLNSVAKINKDIVILEQRLLDVKKEAKEFSLGASDDVRGEFLYALEVFSIRGRILRLENLIDYSKDKELIGHIKMMAKQQKMLVFLARKTMLSGWDFSGSIETMIVDLEGLREDRVFLEKIPSK